MTRSSPRGSPLFIFTYSLTRLLRREARLAVENRESSESAVLQIASFLNDVARLSATNPGKNVEVEVALPFLLRFAV